MNHSEFMATSGSTHKNQGLWKSKFEPCKLADTPIQFLCLRFNVIDFDTSSWLLNMHHRVPWFTIRPHPKIRQNSEPINAMTSYSQRKSPAFFDSDAFCPVRLFESNRIDSLWVNSLWRGSETLSNEFKNTMKKNRI